MPSGVQDEVQPFHDGSCKQVAHKGQKHPHLDIVAAAREFPQLLSAVVFVQVIFQPTRFHSHFESESFFACPLDLGHDPDRADSRRRCIKEVILAFLDPSNLPRRENDRRAPGVSGADGVERRATVIGTGKEGADGDVCEGAHGRESETMRGEDGVHVTEDETGAEDRSPSCRREGALSEMSSRDQPLRVRSVGQAVSRALLPKASGYLVMCCS